VRHHDEVLAGGRPALPAVRDVEDAAADDQRPDARHARRDVVGGRLRDLQAAALDRLHVAVPVPVEQRPDVVVHVGDEPVHRHHVVHHHGSHRASIRP
jgi:hypothetical protein